MNIQDKRFVIIGAGASGMSSAYFLYKSGASKICVFERELLGSGSTGRCAGIVSTQLWNEIDIKLARRSIEIFEEISRKVPYFKVYKKGFISIAGKEKSKKYINRIMDILKGEKINYKIYQGQEAEKAFSFLKNSEDKLILETPDDIYCDSGMFLYTIYSYLRKEKIDLKLLREVEGFRTSNREIKGLWVKGIYYPADIFIICAGVWSKKILEKIGIKIPLLPYRTQIAVLRKKDLTDIPVIYDLDTELYIRKEFPDKAIIGNGTETKESSLIFKENPDEEFIYGVIPEITNIVNDFEDAEYMGGWAGLCAATPDRQPLIGKISEFENLYIIAGFNGFGFMRIPAIAENFVSYLTENRTEIDISSYSIERFKGKEIEKFEIKQGFSFID